MIEAKGKDKRGNGTAGATVTIQLYAGRERHPGGRRHRSRRDRQAGAVRPGCHAGRLRQAARAVHRLHRAAPRGRAGRCPGARGHRPGCCRSGCRPRDRDGGGAPEVLHETGEPPQSSPRRSSAPRRRRLQRAATPGGGRRPRSGPRTTPLTSARQSCRSWSSGTPATPSPPGSASSSAGSSADGGPTQPSPPRPTPRPVECAENDGAD